MTVKIKGNSEAQEPFLYELKVVRVIQNGYGRTRKFNTPRDVYEVFRDRAEKADREEFLALLLDTKNVMLGFHVVSIGALNRNMAHPREVFKAAILANAASVLLVHNHPSGDPKPSEADIVSTKELMASGELLDIPVLDHVIIGDGTYYSFLDNKVLLREEE